MLDRPFPTVDPETPTNLAPGERILNRSGNAPDPQNHLPREDASDAPVIPGPNRPKRAEECWSGTEPGDGHHVCAGRDDVGY
jgi:hypothetical protein